MANTTWNPSDLSGITLSGGNLIATAQAGGGWVRAVDKQVLGKFYWEVTATTNTTASTGIGIASSASVLTGNGFNGGSVRTCGAIHSGLIYVDSTSTGVSLGTITSGTVVCFAYDATARLIWIRLGAAGNWNNSAGNSPATGVGGIACNSLGNGIPTYPAFYGPLLNEAVTANFGDTAFVGAVPSGYTSGFTAGASVPTNAIASQALAEHWLTTNPDARITQVAVEHWQSVTSDNLQAVVTFVALEHWTSVAVVVPAAGGPMVTMIH